MKVGIVYPQPEIGRAPDAIGPIATAVEDLGFNHLLIYDHVLGVEHADRPEPLTGPYTEQDPFQDPFVVFGYLAGITERIELVTGVLILPQRQTPLVARQAADVDLLTGGRLRLGVGLGWNYVEMAALGHDFTRRGRRCTEQIELMRALWSGEVVSYDGAFESAERVRLNPAPTRRIPLAIGGFAPAAIDRAARLCDGFIAAGPIDRGIEVMNAVDAAREKHGTADNEFSHDFVTLMAPSIDDAVEMAHRWRDAGGTHISLSTMGYGIDSVDGYVNLIGQLAERLDVQ